MTDPIHLETRIDEGARIRSSSASRNSEPISTELARILPENARVLEIASGTGEHAVATCQKRHDLIWQPSDPDARSRESQDAWRTECSSQMKPSLSLDAMQNEWWDGLGPFDAVFCANMIHIAPWEAALGVAEGVRHIVKENGLVILYGPFLEGEDTAQSNLVFDQNLKSRNASWGVRDLDSVKHIFADVGFNLQARIVMPAENRILLFSNA